MKAALPLAERIAIALVYRNNVNIRHMGRFGVVVEIDLHMGKFYFRNNKYSISVLTRLDQKLYKRINASVVSLSLSDKYDITKIKTLHVIYLSNICRYGLSISISRYDYEICIENLRYMRIYGFAGYTMHGLFQVCTGAWKSMYTTFWQISVCCRM